jgi:hypothetical protein
VEAVMPKGISLHIGINEIDPSHYDGWNGKLNACENDAKDMQDIAKCLGYETTLLLTENAVAASVLKGIGLASQELTSGDIFLLTYSGHGSRIPDISGDEEDRYDETWVLYDRMLTDDELYTMWSRFDSGVRILVISDSCHSGTVVKKIEGASDLLTKLFPEYYSESERQTYKSMPLDISLTTCRKNIHLYESIQWLCSRGDSQLVSSSVILLAACQDNQTASDGHRNSLFTAILKQVWNEGLFKGEYGAFCKALIEASPPTQTPKYYKTGSLNPEFEKQSPFSI